MRAIVQFAIGDDARADVGSQQNGCRIGFTMQIAQPGFRQSCRASFVFNGDRQNLTIMFLKQFWQIPVLQKRQRIAKSDHLLLRINLAGNADRQSADLSLVLINNCIKRLHKFSQAAGRRRHLVFFGNLTGVVQQGILNRCPTDIDT